MSKPEVIISQFGARLKQARIDASLSQEALAEALSVSRTTIQVWEKGSRNPEFARLGSIATTTGKPLAWFFLPGAGFSKNAPQSLDEALEQFELAQGDVAEANQRLEKAYENLRGFLS